MTKKYDINAEGRVVALRDFGDVKVGDVGGFVWSEKNLSHEGNCWIYENARVYGEAQVCENAWVFGNALVYGEARVCGDARVCGEARVCENAWVFGNARVCGEARVYGEARVCGDAQVCGDAWVFGNARVYGNAQIYENARVYGIARSDGFSFCYVPCADMEYRVIAGCRYFTMPEAREHWGTEHPQHEETYAILDALEILSKVREEGCV